MSIRKYFPTARWAISAAVVAAAYFATGKLGLAFDFVEGISLVWMPAGIALAALVLGGLRLWPAILIGDFLTGYGELPSAGAAAGVAAANTLALVVGAALLRRRRFRGRFVELAHLVDFALFGLLVTPLLAATLGLTARTLLGIFQSPFAVGWLAWWAGDTVGILLVAPAIFAWKGFDPVKWWRSRRSVEPIVIAVALVASALAAWELQGPAVHHYPLSFLPFPLLAWAAVRFGQRGATAASLLLAAVATWGMLAGTGPFVRDDTRESLALLWTFLGTVATTGLVISVLSHRLRSAAGVAENEERLKLALEGAEDGIWDWDLAANKMVFSERWAAMLGYEPNEIDSSFRGWMQLVHPDDTAGVKKALEAHLEGKIPVYQTEHRMRAHSGEWRWILARGKVVRRDATGRPLRMSGTHKDITERKRARQALLKSEALVRAIFETAADGILITNESGTIESFNAAAERIFGYSAAEVVGRQVSMLVPPAEAGYEKTYVARLLGIRRERQRGSLRQVLGRRRDGDDFPMDIAVAEVPSAETRRLFSAIVRDVTAREQAEELLKLHRAMVENMSEGMQVIRTVDGVIVYANPRFAEMFEYGPGELVGQHASVVYAPEDRSARELTANMMDSLDKKGIWRGEVRSKKKGDDIFWCRIKAAVFDHPKFGRVWVSVHEDITDLVRAEEERHYLEDQLRQTHKMESIGQLASGVAHTFNNLLVGIGGNLDFVIDEIERDTPVYRDVRAAQAAVDRAAALTRKLLAFGKRPVLEPVDVDLNVVMSDLLPMLKSTITENVELEFLPGETAGTVHIDVAQIEQVVLNLCVNARDAMPEGGKVTIRTDVTDLDTAFVDANPWAQEGPHLLLSIHDEGTGMDEATLSQAFEPFFTTKKASTSTGLGLAIVKSIVREHDAVLDVESAPGAGTTFRIYLPRSDREAELMAEESGIHVRGGFETILLAEDESIVRNVARRILEQAGYTVLVAEDGQRAARLFEEHADEVDLVILDLIMPVLGGMGARQKILKIRSDARFLLASGYATEVPRDSSGAEIPLVSKPFHHRGLLRKVREILDSPPPGTPRESSERDSVAH